MLTSKELSQIMKDYRNVYYMGDVDCWFLALKEITVDQFNDLSAIAKSIRRIDDCKKDLAFLSRKVAQLDFDSDVYDYYKVCVETKRAFNCFTVRVAR